MNAAAERGERIAVSAISLVEMVYLVEKGRIPAQRFSELAREMDIPDSIFLETAVNLGIARSLTRVDVAQIPDMPDRVIAATALSLGVPLISRDGKIRVSSVETIW
jgi:PIN domain nuclease of toxin-antitoxin system